MPRVFPGVVRLKRGRRQGFALLVTITLLAFLVLLLVSLAALTRVETQVASNNQTVSQARQNALFALSVALGQLQKYSGPDQRVTARADITTVDDKLTRDASGEPVVTDVKNPHWTGVWDSGKWDALTGKYDGAPRARTRPEVMTWLVSGNETATTPRKYTPKDALPAASAATPKQVLVNGVAADGSIDPANPRVEVPVVSITSDAVPGIPGNQTIGHYAWWVGDEGVKARLSSIAPATVSDQAQPLVPTASGAQLYYWKAMAPSRSGGELAGTSAARLFPDFDEVFATTAGGEALRTNLRNVISPRQLALLPAGSSGASIVPEIALRKNAPAFTTVSRGVLADTVRGGLRFDLTRYLETGNTDGAFNAADSIYADAALAGVRQPAFSLLRSWYDAGRGLTGGGFNVTAAVQPEAVSGSVITGQGLFPVITRYQVALAAMSAGPGSPLVLVFHPSITLWNPHNVTLAATDLVLELDENFDFRFTVEAVDAAGTFKRSYLNNSPATDPSGNPYRYSGASLASMGIGNPPAFRMSIPGVQMAPGETLVFTLKGNGSIPSTEPAPLNGAVAASFSKMEPQWNDKHFLTVTTALTLDSTPLSPGESLKFYMGRSVPEPFRFKARLYRESDHAAGVTLQRMEHAFNEGDGQNPKDVAATSTFGKPYTLEATPPTDSGAFRTNVVAMRLPCSAASAGTSTNAPAVPFAQFNVRGAYGVNTSFERSDQALAGDAFFASYRYKGLAPMAVEPGADKDLGFTGPAETSQPVGGTNQGNYYVFFDYPRAETAVAGNGGYPAMISLGEFQHADLSSNSLQPTYVFGNSWPDPRLGRESVAGRWSGYPAALNPKQTVFAANDYLLRDASYLANHALWDRFFLSTIPQHTANASFDDTTVLPNVRLKSVPGMVAGKTGYPDLTDVRDTRKAAGSLLLDGAFNINSTSVDAWRALLGGLADLPVPTEGWAQDGVSTGGTANPAGRGLRHTYSRFLLPRGEAFDQTTSSFGAGSSNGGLCRSAWTGHRYLTDTEIDTLARNIVEEVKVRGPFMSLADFVNRRLITATADEATSATSDLDKHRLKIGALGALQKAILNLPDVSKGLNAALNQPTMASVNFNYTGGSAKVFRNGLVTTDISFRGIPNYPSQLELLNGGLLGQLNYGAPGFLTQADVLQKIGSVIAARSDTFVVRTYGDATNPATGDVEGRAWCEAVVQRLPEFVEPSQPPETALSSLTPLNRDFGRRYRVVSFRWLTPVDL